MQESVWRRMRNSTTHWRMLHCEVAASLSSVPSRAANTRGQAPPSPISNTQRVESSVAGERV